jgi:siroheme synthase-like protein
MNSYPINLMLENKTCLVVGGGKVAARKINDLLAASTYIKVVSLKFIKDIASLAHNKNVELFSKNYTPDDLDGVFLVYAATNNNNLNRQIMECAKQRDIICCGIDTNWPYGDFITPASACYNNTVFSFSTNGQHCVKAKFIKNIVADYLRSIYEPEIVVIGIDHTNTTIEKLDAVQKAAYRLPLNMKKWLNKLNGIYEFSILKTCNRLEIITLMNYDTELIEIVKGLPGFNEVSSSSIYSYRGFDAFKYLCTLASGIHSQIIGENHITFQLKRALIDNAHTNQSKLLISIANLVLQVSKVIRNLLLNELHLLDIEEILKNSTKKFFPTLNKLKVVIAGSGEMGQSLVPIFSRAGCNVTCLYHKTKPKSLYSINNVTIDKLSHWDSFVYDADIFISSLSVKEPYFKEEDFSIFKHCKIIFDVGIPRNISCELEKKLTNQHYIHFSSLKNQSKGKSVERNELIREAHKLIDNFHERYNEISKSYKSWHQKK